jgi:hypothetical protein
VKKIVETAIGIAVTLMTGIAVYYAAVHPAFMSNAQFIGLVALIVLFSSALAVMLNQDRRRRLPALPELNTECRTLLRYIRDHQPCEVLGVPGLHIDDTRKSLSTCSSLGLIRSAPQRAAGPKTLYPKLLYSINPRYMAALERL